MTKMKTIAERGSESLEEPIFLIAVAALISLMIGVFMNGNILMAVLSLIALPIIIGIEITWWYFNPPS